MAKQKRSKVSSIKLSNKSLKGVSRMSKSEKTSKRKIRSQIRQQRAPDPSMMNTVGNPEYDPNISSSDTDAPVDGSDDQFLPFETRPRNAFSNVYSGPDYEIDSMRELLPIKIQEKVVVQKTKKRRQVPLPSPEVELAVDHESQQDVAEMETEVSANVCDVACDEPVDDSAISPLEMFAERKRRISVAKTEIGKLSSLVTEDPQGCCGKCLKDLLLFLHVSHPLVAVTVRKLAILSMAEVFKDIIPDYHIRSYEDEELQPSKVSKEVRGVRQFEQSLVRQYSQYLGRLEVFIDASFGGGKKTKKLLSTEDVAISKEGLCSLGLASLNSMLELLTSKPWFNFKSNIIKLIVPLMDHYDNKVSERCCQAVETIFKEDSVGSLSLEIVTSMSSLIKRKLVRPRLLATFLSLNMQEGDMKKADEDQQKRREETKRKKQEWTKLSKNDKRSAKFEKKWDKELLEIEAEETDEKKQRFQTQSLKQIFYIYFRVLKNPANRQLLGVVLEGVSQFAHLINVDFFDDLLGILYQLTDDLTTKDVFHCFIAVFKILSGQGSALNIDPSKFYIQLYSTMISIDCGQSGEMIELLLKSLELMLVRRRKQVSLCRQLAFMKRLCSMSLSNLTANQLAILMVVRQMLMTNPKSDVLLDTTCFGQVYQPLVQDPDHCNPEGTSLWELSTLRRHYHPVVVSMANHLACGAPLRGSGSISSELSTLSPMEMLQRHRQWDMDFEEKSVKRSQSPFPARKSALLRDRSFRLYIRRFLNGN